MRFTRSTLVIDDWKQYTRFRIAIGFALVIIAFAGFVALTKGATDPQEETSATTTPSEIMSLESTTTPAISDGTKEAASTEDGVQFEEECATSTVQTLEPESVSSSTQSSLEQTLVSVSQPQGILTPSGYKPISEIQIGDQVIGYDLETQSQVTNTVEKIEFKTPEQYNYWEIDEEGRPTTLIERPFIYYTVNGVYELFQDQSVFANERLVHASELQIGDTLHTDEGLITISSITQDTNHTDWLRFSVSGDHSYIQDGLIVHNASRYWVGGGASANWNATGNTNWSATSGGSNNASVPGSSDDVFFDGVGGGASNSTISAAISINSLDMTGYSNTLTHNGSITVTVFGNLMRLSPGMTYTRGNGGSSFSFTSTTGTVGSPTTIYTSGKSMGGTSINGSGGNYLFGDDYFGIGVFTQSNGTLTTTSSTTLGQLVLSNGTFNAPSGTLTMTGNFTISGGTFNANGGTVTFSGSTATIACNNATFNLVTFTNTSTKTVNSDCSLPLGANPTVGNGGGVTLLGTLSGSGTITTSSTFTSSSTNPLSGFSALAATNFTLSAGTFTAPASTTVSSTFTISGGTFNANGGILTFSGSTATLTCNNATFNLVVFANTGTKTVSSDCSFPLGNNPALGSGTVSLRGTLSGTGTLTGGNLLTASSTNPLVGFTDLVINSLTVSAGTFPALTSATVSGAFTLSDGIFTAPTTMSVGGNFTISGGTFNHNNGTITFNVSSATLACNNTILNRVIFTHAVGTKTISNDCSLPLGDNPTVSSSISLRGTLTGTGILTVAAGTFTASSTAPLSGFSGLLVGQSFAQTAGTFTAPATTTIASTFTLSGGTFTAGSNLTVNSTFTISGGTFDANGGTLTFRGSTATLTCNNATFNLIVFANTSTKTISEDCSFPLGSDPTLGTGGITVRGTLSGTGTLTAIGTFTASSTNPLSGFSGFNMGNFVLSAGTFTAPTSMSVSGTFTISGGTFNHNNGTITFTSSSAMTCANTTFYHVVLSHTGGIKTIPSGCTLPLGDNPTAGSSSVTLEGTLSGTGTLTMAVNFSYRNTAALSGFTGLVVNKGSGGTGGDLSVSGGTFDASSYTLIDLEGDFTISNSGIFTAPALMTVAGDWEMTSGTFNHNNSTVTLDDTNSTSISGSTTFYNFTRNVSSDAPLVIDAGSTQTVLNNFSLSGTSDNFLSLQSSSPGTQWNIDAQGAVNLSYLNVQDSNAIVALSTTGTDSGNNTNWTITAVPSTSVYLAPNANGGGSGYIPGYEPRDVQVPVIPIPCSMGEKYNNMTGTLCATLTSSSTIPTSLTFTQDLFYGVTHPEVKSLQQYLNSIGFTIAPSGAGSPGQETNFFGALTRAALIKFQKVRGIMPTLGYFGEITRRFISTH